MPLETHRKTFISKSTVVSASNSRLRSDNRSGKVMVVVDGLDLQVGAIEKTSVYLKYLILHMNDIR